MTISTGTYSHFGYSIQSTKGTRVAPSISYPIISETLGDTGRQLTARPGIVYGNRGVQDVSAGKSNITGNIVAEVTADSLGGLLYAALGKVTTTGTTPGPYTHVITRDPAALPFVSAQVGWTDNASTDFRKDYTGLQVASLALSVSGGTDPQITVAFVGGVEEIDQYPLVTPSYGAMKYFLFSDMTITPDGGSAMCWDSFDFTIANNPVASAAVCPDQPRSTVYTDTGQFGVTGTLVRDFDGSFADYTKFINGTGATLSMKFTSGDDVLQADMGIRYTGSTPQVAGPSNIKHNLPFMAVGDMGDMITVTLTNGDATIDGS